MLTCIYCLSAKMEQCGKDDYSGYLDERSVVYTRKEV